METKFKITLEGNKKIFAHFQGFSIDTDQQEKEDGNDSAAPSAFELFLASIGTCAGFYIASFCQSHSIPTGNISIVQTASWNNKTHMVDKITLDILLPPNFPEKYKDGVIKAADISTVRKHLLAPPEIQINAKT